MAGAPINPTQLTPPRVAFIDPQTGAISREWYRFFLSLLTGLQSSQDIIDTTPSSSSLVASYEDVFARAVQALSAAPSAATAELQASLNAAVQALSAAPSAATAELQASLNAAVQAAALAASHFESVAADLQTQIQALALNPPPKEYIATRYGSFYDTTDQTAAVANTAYAMTFNATEFAFGVTIGTPTSRVYVDRSNIYNIQFSAQLINTAGGAHETWIWLRKNGTDVPNTTTAIRIEGNNTQAVAAWNFLLDMNAGDYFELMWEVADTAVSLQYDAATAVHPAIPSIILTVTDNIGRKEV